MAGGVIGPVIRAAGGVLWRPAEPEVAPGGVEIAVIHRPRYDDWSLPKGKLTGGESDLEGAVREVLEETGFHVRVGRPLGETTYREASANGERLKVVRWWSMEADEGAFSPTNEVDQLEWVSLAEATRVVTRDTDRDVLERFARGPVPTRTVLLVRHCRAGSRGAWDGDDRERPLDDCGVAQADELVRILSQFEVGSILSAGVRRCMATVEPLAATLRLAVTEEPLLSEVCYSGREEEALAIVRSLGDADHDAVACTQGEVIGDLVARLATADGYPLAAPVQARKGSVWALSLDADGRLVAADHLNAPAPAACRPTG